MMIIKPAHQALEVSGAIAVRLHIATDREAINDCVLIP
jgi:hypothetical protein